MSIPPHVPRHHPALWLAAVSLLLAGCATAPRLTSVTSVNDDDAAYLVFGALGSAGPQQAVARRIATRELDRILRSRPAAEVRLLETWEGHLASLREPIAIQTGTYRRAPELQGVADLNLISDYIARNPGALSLNGAEILPDWADAVRGAESAVAGLRQDLAEAMRKAGASAEARRWPEAFAAIREAVAVAPRDPQVLGPAQDIQDRLAQETIAGLDAGLKRNLALQARHGTPESSLEAVTQANQTLLESARQALAIEAMLAEAPIPFRSPETRGQLAALRKSALEATGANWAEGIRLQAAAKEFWATYGQTMEILASIDAQPAYRDTQARTAVVRAFLDQTPDAVNHFLERSNKAYYQDRYGMAFLASRVSRELYDYAGSLPGANLESLDRQIRQADQTAVDSAERIGLRYARRLLVTDFVPAVTEDYENIGFQIRTRCRYLTLPRNGRAWALSVPSPRTLVLEGFDDITPLDLGLSGVMDKKIQVDVFPPEEQERGYTEVGTPLIRQAPNPLHGYVDGAAKTIFTQEVHLYPWIKTLHRKNARIAFRVVREYLDGASRTIYQVDETYPNERMTFRDLAVQSESLDYQPMLLGTPRHAASRTALKIDTPPVGRAPAFAANDEIANAVVNHVIGNVMVAIEHEVVQFPVDTIAAEALRAVAERKKEEAADLWGHFLVYVEQLLPAEEGGTGSWMKRREQLSTTVREWLAARWKDQPEATRKAIEDPWHQALTAFFGAP